MFNPTMPPRQPTKQRKALPFRERRYAEDCAPGDVAVWARPPLVRPGNQWEPAPSEQAELTMFVGRAPYAAFGRFILPGGGQTEPMEIRRGQQLVKIAR